VRGYWAANLGECQPPQDGRIERLIMAVGSHFATRCGNELTEYDIYRTTRRSTADHLATAQTKVHDSLMVWTRRRAARS